MKKTPDLVIESNRAYFDQNAQIYDADEPCMVEQRSQRVVADHLQRIVTRLFALFPTVPLRVLDAGGGSGNISIKLVRLGLIPDLVDVSQQMIDLYLSKLPSDVRARSRTVCSDLETFLSSSDQYHLICFSSVLHHLVDYKAVLDLAAKRLQPGGFIYTIHDPCLKTRFWNKVDMADYHLSSWARFVNYVQRKWRRENGNSDGQDAGTGAGPEPHVTHGIDDFDLRKHFEDKGMQIIWHERFATAKTLPVTIAYRLARRAIGFSFAVQKQDRVGG